MPAHPSGHIVLYSEKNPVLNIIALSTDVYTLIIVYFLLSFSFILTNFKLRYNFKK